MGKGHNVRDLTRWVRALRILTFLSREITDRSLWLLFSAYTLLDEQSIQREIWRGMFGGV